MFFEGPEKKFELLVEKAQPSFRGRSESFYSELVETAGAKILSKISNESCDAYLLSESSLFVYDDRVLMITCGQTRLVHAVEFLLKEISIDHISSFIYERKNELFPHLQQSSFFDDSRILKSLMPGKSFRFGDEDSHHLMAFHMQKDYSPGSDDTTLEILMHGVQSEVCTLFSKGKHEDKEAVLKKSGVREILPGFTVDDYFFDPEGYSLNAIKENDYFTVHVTPQENGSYVSFETSYDYRDSLSSIVSRVINIFNPKAFDVVLFHRDDVKVSELPGYNLKSEVVEKLDCGYHAGFFSYYQPYSGRRTAFEIVGEEL